MGVRDLQRFYSSSGDPVSREGPQEGNSHAEALCRLRVGFIEQ